MDIWDLNRDDRAMLLTLCRSLLKQSGQVLLLPTETVYGLMCSWRDTEAREAIYGLKQREGHKPLQMLVHQVEQVVAFGIKQTPFFDALCRECCPGPITIVVPLADSSEKIGFRIPDHPFILDLLKQSGVVLAATSANISGEPPCLTVEEAMQTLNGQPAAVVDEGAIHPHSQASTVVEVLADGYKILRPGPISEEQIEQIYRQSKN